jgi:hypothetical protein
MALIDLIVDVAIAASSAAPSLPSTDTIALLGYHTHYTDLIRTYFQPSDMIADGFTVNDPLYLMAAAIAAQTPHVNKFKVIRGTTSVQQTMTFQVTDTQTGHVVGFILTDASGVTHAVQHTNTVGQTAVQIATALAGVSVSGATLANGGGTLDTVTVTITASGAIWYPSSITGGNWTDTTVSASPATDLTNAALVDPDFYGVSGEWMSAANISAIAGWCESNNRLHAYTTPDTNNLTLGSGIFNTAKVAGYNRTYGQFGGTPIQYGATALMGNRFTNPAGSDTWAFVSLASVNTDALTPSQIEAATSLEGAVSNNGNVYVPVANVGATLTGLAASGLFIDIQRGIDALTNDIKLRLFTMMTNLSQQGKRIPYTRRGASMVKGQVNASLQAFVNSGFLSNDSGFEPEVTVPDPNLAAPADKSKRIYRGVTFTCTAQGAMQTVVVRGTVSF